MKTLVKFLIVFSVFFSAYILAQDFGVLKEVYTPQLPENINSLSGKALQPGIYLVGSPAVTPNSFPTIQAAFNKLSKDGILGTVTLVLTNNYYKAPAPVGFYLIGPIPGASAHKRVVMRPADNLKVTIEGDGASIFYMKNVSYFTFEGVGLSGPTRLTINNLAHSNYPYGDGIDFIDNSDFNVIQNITFTSEDYSRISNGPGLWTNEISGAAPDYNLIQKNLIKKAGCGIFLYSAGKKAVGNIIRDNLIGYKAEQIAPNIRIEKIDPYEDGMVAMGIYAGNTESTLIEKNIIQDVMAYSFYGMNFGINSYQGSANIIRNNLVKNVRGINGHLCVGILLSGSESKFGQDNLIYNNMVMEIQSAFSPSDLFTSGIAIGYQMETKIFFNSVYLCGNGQNAQGSSALSIYSKCGLVDMKNNILINGRDESPYCAVSIYDGGARILKSDHNDLFIIPNGFNCLVQQGNVKYPDIKSWQDAGNDPYSFSQAACFCGWCLHINPAVATMIESGGVPIYGIETDFDGDLRHKHRPDVGADEFECLIFSSIQNPLHNRMLQNYPNPFNPVTQISYNIPEQTHVRLIIYDAVGSEVAVLVDEEKPAGDYTINFTGADLPSGVYLYSLTAGDFKQTKKMILLK